MPKKNGKSTLAALVAAYGLLADGEPYPEIYGTAGSKDQAKIIFGQTVRAIQRSPILLNEVDIYKDVIERKDGQGFYKVLSSDAVLQHGLNAHFVIWDELWNQPNYDLWEALTHSPARKQPLHFVVSYASFRPWEGDLLFDLYTNGRKKKDKRMWFYWSHTNHASWVTPDYLRQQKQRLPEHIYLRLHENRWTTGSGTFLTEEDIKAAVSSELKQRFNGEPGLNYFLSLDLGLRRDRTVIAIVHKDPDSGFIILNHIRTFEAPKGGEIQIVDIEEHILQIAQSFPLRRITFDPWQSIRTKQRLEERGLRVEEFVFSGQNWVRLTQNLFSLFRDRRIKIFYHKQLIKELLSVKIVEKSYGYRIDTESGAHDDHVIALGMASLAAMQTKAATGPILLGFYDGNIFESVWEKQQEHQSSCEPRGPQRPYKYPGCNEEAKLSSYCGEHMKIKYHVNSGYLY